MNKIVKILVFIVLGIIVIIGGLLVYVKTMLPSVGKAPEMKVELTAQRIERGAYLANHVSVCIDCHSKRDWSKYAGPLVKGTEGMGGELFGPDEGFPGKFYASNITPAGIGSWTDGELFRAITSGVTKEGKALFPVMPYLNLGKMDREDVLSIIAYIRSLKGIQNDVPASVASFPMNFIINTIPQKPAFTSTPSKLNKVEYGKYMVNAAGCAECHTRQVKGKAVEGMEFAGGFEFRMPGDSILRSANITPDKETGIGAWNVNTFISLFKSYTDSAYKSPVVKSGAFNTLMPWTMYSGMKEDDLAAIFAYLQTLPPVKNKVNRYTPAR
ncbi:MAG: c-type cytochrome [Bacteroidia bacterium]|nr:c-type cytochrome [Bacteroidia bacterium]